MGSLCRGVAPRADFGIACRGAVGSVLLLSRQPFDQLSGSSILFTADSVTSVELARQLLDRAGNNDYRVEYGESPGAHDACLVIGDRALVESRQSAWPYQTDLSQRWLDETGLPFVFARWMARRSVSRQDRERLVAALHASLDSPWPVDRPNRAGMDPAEARAYLENMTYRLDARCQEAINLFRTYCYVVA